MKNATVLGIMSIPRNSLIPFSPVQHESFLEIISFANQINCHAYVFNPLEIDWHNKVTQCYKYSILRTGGTWEKAIAPLPDVIYNRIPNRRLENREDIQQSISIISKKYGQRFFNPCFLDKWTVYQLLSKHPKGKNYVPKTKLLHNPQNITEMLSRYDCLYIKPRSDSLGNRMYKVQQEENRIKYTHQCIGISNSHGYVKDCTELLTLILQSSEDIDFIIQEAISLCTFKGRPFDLRYLIQKNKVGLWKMTGEAARVAGENSISTHLSYGGFRETAENALKASSIQYNFSPQKVRDQIEELQAIVPFLIENAYHASFGELEMDIGIDKKGQVWCFEANSKPFKFDEHTIRTKSLGMLMDYAIYLNFHCKPVY